MSATVTETLLLNGKQVAQLIGVTEGAVKRLRESGLPYVQLNRRALYRKEDVQKWLESRATVATPRNT